ncbi:hypothetical protein Q5424_18845 [Conexibacter sp. JD483]|uniref:hypothetical protein n=1 Tax=unclassified Conexibacter TaxID=2627773 RepID=UPI002725EB25|nr:MULTISPECIES: hypothetical protein [unclassified Conexibacter]MDO8188749.1 hypothetical protein [Conexibacter sp. CPCC 205706]MDO8199901.1 hypothetical protein [Conexibacter sp. CPCC 205762]MDR9371162.1 hypothetical protein [Conexibacter sp. JD483]
MADRARHDVLTAAAVAGVVSGVPSTVWTLRAGGDLVESSRAAGALLVGERRSAGLRLTAAVPVHAALSIGWSALLARTLPGRHEPLWGAVAGAGIAALDLGLIGRRIPAIAALAQGPQWADHVAFGAAVGIVLHARRR